MTVVLLARHGETDWNAERRIQGHTNSTLSDLGRRQADALAKRLTIIPLAAIYASDLDRALETAAPIAALQGIDVQPVFDLRERSFGAWEGMTAAEIERDYPEEWNRWHLQRDLHAPIPGGETWEEVSSRISSALESILTAHPRREETVLLVGHGGSLRAAVLKALHAPLATLQHLHFDNASLSRLEFQTPHGGRVLLLNDTCHLEGLLP